MGVSKVLKIIQLNHQSGLVRVPEPDYLFFKFWFQNKALGLLIYSDFLRNSHRILPPPNPPPFLCIKRRLSKMERVLHCWDTISCDRELPFPTQVFRFDVVVNLLLNSWRDMHQVLLMQCNFTLLNLKPLVALDSNFPKNMVETAQFLGLITCKDIHGTWNETQTAASWRTTPQDPNQP